MIRSFHARGRRRRATRTLLALVAASLAAATIGPASALAASTTLANSTTLAGGSTLTAVPFNTSGGGVNVSGTAEITMSWSQPASLSTTFDPNLLRQGRTLALSDAYGRSAAGAMSVSYTLTDLTVSWGSVGPLSLGSPGFTATGSCNLLAGGPNYVCNLSSPQTALYDNYPVPGPYVKLSLAAAVTVTPQGLATLRTATLGGNPAGSASLTLGETPITDNLPIPCSAGAGDELLYNLGGLSATDGLSVDTSLVFDVGLEAPSIVPPFNEEDASFGTPSIDMGTTTGSVAMAGSGATFDIGAVQANNVPPVANAGGPYTGNEGSPISFDGSGSSSICGFPTLQWNFSDGGVAYGEFPQHTFQGPGTYSGQLTATDATGLVSTTDFSVTVANLPPVVNAGPDTTAAWGRPVAFNGSAVDPGANDQATLSYSWNFGDGTVLPFAPSGAGGSSAYHAYATPGTYTATLSVCDQWGASDNGCSSGTRTVVVQARSVTAAYLGATAGTYDTPGTLSASLTDQFGQAVVGRSVTFKVGGNVVGSSTTGPDGTATLTYTPALRAGTYGTEVSFPGDSLYDPASATGSITIAPKATSVSYTGAVTALPNHTVTLSAVLHDATGTALSGKTITFQLGSQSVSATTDANGVATATLQLSQKIGSYPLTATYTPDSPDSGFYVGSAASTSFTIGKNK
jgi:PKD repeat protein